MHRRFMHLTRLLHVALVLVFSLAITAVSRAAASEPPPSDLQKYVEAMQPGWNVGNTLDSTGADETSWGQPRITPELFKALAANGYKSVRIPITWFGHMGNAPDYKVNKDYMDRVQQVVDMALAEHLHVLINIHHDSKWIFPMESQHDEVLGRFNALWTQIAGRFRDYPQTLSFESVNEPRFSEDWGKDAPQYFSMLDELNQSFHNIVRKSGGGNATRPLVIPTLCAAPAQARLDEAYGSISRMNDKNIIATVHYYGFYPFSVALGGGTFDDKTRQDIEKTFDGVYNTFVAKGIPVILGEFGLLGFDRSLDVIEHGESLKFFEYLSYYVRQKHITAILWDNGQHLNRRTLQWNDPSLHQVLEAGLNGHRSSTTERDCIYLKSGGPLEDVNLKMSLNGNTLVAIRNGDAELAKGTDYDVHDETLTFKRSFLKSVLSKGYGVKASLTCKFSAGADWMLTISSYAAPTLKPASGTTKAFAIPAVFNGDKLQSMESVYPSGGNTPPNVWTPYKGFMDSVIPDYDAGRITLSPEYLVGLKDGQVDLKMHFWSGAVVKYVITKKGTVITGGVS